MNNTDFSYTQEIEKFYKEFPEFHEKVFFINPDTYQNMGEFLRENPELEKKIEKFTSPKRAEELGIESCLPKFLYFNEAHINTLYIKGSFCMTFYDQIELLSKRDPTKKYEYASLIILQSDKSRTLDRDTQLINSFNIASYKDMLDKDIIKKHTFYHETGHVLFEQNNTEEMLKFMIHRMTNSRNNKDFDFICLGETTAESYAMIRLIQEYGIDNPTVEFLISQRIIDRLGHADSTYNFTPALDEIVRLAREDALSDLSLHEVIDVADKIAKEHAVTVADSRLLAKNVYAQYLQFHDAMDIQMGAENLISTIPHIKEPVVLRDIQYIVHCLDSLTSNDPKLQKAVKNIHSALQKNSLVKEGKATIKPAFHPKQIKVQGHKSSPPLKR